jgi:hypothetical protein
MSRSTSDLGALPTLAERGAACVLAALLAACGGDPPVVALCARGDRDVLAAEVTSLELRFLDAGGATLGAPVALDARDTHVGSDPPDGAARVSAIGFDAAGAPVARGAADLAGGGACVCFALDGQARAACEAVTCGVVGDRCRFYGADGAPLGSQTLGFGERADITGVTSDTYLQEDQPAATHDRAVIEAGPNPNRAGLLRFDLSALPRSAVIEDARLVLHVCTTLDCGSSQSLSVHAVLEPWREDATWLERQPGAPWLAAGCGAPASCAAASIGSLIGAPPGSTAQAQLAAAQIAAWVADPSTNLGLALLPTGTSGTALHVDASEATAADAAPPKLEVIYHLE